MLSRNKYFIYYEVNWNGNVLMSINVAVELLEELLALFDITTK